MTAGEEFLASVLGGQSDRATPALAARSVGYVDPREAALVALQIELAAQRFTGVSDDRLVTAVVSGGGDVVDITFSSHARSQSHPRVLGDHVVAAIRSARMSAAEYEQQCLREFQVGPS